MGASKGSSQSQVQMTPEQQQALKAQTDFLTQTAFPAYQKTIASAADLYGNTSNATNTAVNNATNVANTSSNLLQKVGNNNLQTGSTGLRSLFGPKYEQNQIQAALQSGRESARESQAGQNAMYGAAGALGSSRQALADNNMQSLNAQRQATAAAGAQALVQSNKAAAAGALLSSGQSQIGAANATAGSAINYAQSPQDLYSKYASVIYGTPQSSTTPNFTGTQGGTSSGKSMKLGG